jgi:uncharacterized membrane protein
MAFCSGCGTEVAADAAFCPKCGKPNSTAVPVGTAIEPAQGTGIQQNIAGALCYALGWITGLVFFLIDKRPFVRFHAMQSMIIFGAVFIIQRVLFWSGFFGGLLGFAFVGMINGLLWLILVICWIVCIIKAYQGNRYKLPVVGDLAENWSK